MENKKDFEDISHKSEDVYDMLAKEYDKFLLFADAGKHALTITNGETFQDVTSLIWAIISDEDDEGRESWFRTLVLMSAAAMHESGKARNTMRSILKNCPELAEKLGVEIKEARPGASDWPEDNKDE